MSYGKYRPISKAVRILILAILLISISGCGSKEKVSELKKKPEITKFEKWTQIGNDIYVITSDFYLSNMIIVASGTDAVLIDTGMDDKDLLTIKELLALKGLELKSVIITHMHQDHTANLYELKGKEVTVYTPDNTSDEQIIKYGDKSLKLFFTEGHYRPKGHISVELINEKILIAGDILCNNIIPPLSSGNGDMTELMSTLKKLEERNYSVIIPGHGEIIENELLFQRNRGYLKSAEKLVKDIIEAGGVMRDLRKIKLTDCIEDTSYLFAERLDFWHQRTLETIYVQLKRGAE
ncbi:MAG: MBL fold metallo-hydrolase [Bacillota bacterium]